MIIKIIKKIYLLLFLILLVQQDIYALALQPLAGQSEIKKRYTAAESYIYYRRDLQFLIDNYGVSRDILIKFSLARNKMDGKVLTIKDGRKFELKAEISADGVFEVKLIDLENDRVMSDTVFACDDTLCLDTDLEEVRWGDVAEEDLSKLGIGTQLTQMFFEDWFDFKGEQYIINVPTVNQIIDRKPINLFELYEEFEKTPIGKITKRCGVTKYIIKYFSKPTNRVRSEDTSITVTQENIADFLYWLEVNETFLLSIDYKRQLTYQEARFLAYRYLNAVRPDMLYGEPKGWILSKTKKDNLELATVMLGINKRNLGDYTIECLLLKNGWVNIFLRKNDITSSMVAEIMPGKLNIFLNGVTFDNISLDLTQKRLGSNLVSMINDYIPLGYAIEVLVLNDKTNEMLAESKINNLRDIDINFALTPIGKLFIRSGFGNFKYSVQTLVEYEGGIKKEILLPITSENAKAFPALIKCVYRFVVNAVKLQQTELPYEDIDLLPLIQNEMEGQVVDKFKLKTTISKDGGLYIYLVFENIVDDQAVLVVLPDLSTDIELEESKFGDLRGQGIGKKLFTLMGKAIIVGTECKDLVVNTPTVDMIYNANITCMQDLHAIFNVTPVGKLHWAAGYNEYDFYFYDPMMEREVLVTEDNVVRLYKNIKKRGNFELVSKKTMTKEELVMYYDYVIYKAGGKYIGIQQGIADIEDMIMFNAPSGTTLAILRSKFCYEAVLDKLGKSILTGVNDLKSDLQVFPNKDVNSIEIFPFKGDMILNKNDYLKIIRKHSDLGLGNILGVLKAA